MTKTRRLARRFREALSKVKRGADVWDYGLARTLRELERKHPECIWIGPPPMFKGSGAEQMPYFGAIATAIGKRALKREKEK